ncbi:MAG: hypothetical protein AB7S26_13610 [Sandaracinaceae bacterium]
MSSPDEQRDLPRGAFVALALALPLALFAVHHDLGHAGDLEFFHRWYLAFREGPAFYRDGPGLNYPILGVLAVCGPARIADAVLGTPLSLAEYRLVLKATLVVGEFALISGLAALGRELRLPTPRRLALVVFALPAVWSVGGWFGQVDVWGTTLLVAACAAAIRYARSGSFTTLLVALACAIGALLMKQLTLFSLPGVALLIASGLAARRRPSHVALALVAPLACLLPDPWLTLPDGYRSHLAWVLLGGGSAHGDMVSGGGASVWALVFGNPSWSARSVGWLGVSLYHWALALFFTALVPALAWLRARWREPSAVVLFIGYTNLAMAVLLTGVHERYVVHGAPFLLLGVAARASRPAFVLLACVLSWWGLFVLASLHPDAAILWPFRRAEPTAIALAVTLVALALAMTRRARGEEEAADTDSASDGSSRSGARIRTKPEGAKE